MLRRTLVLTLPAALVLPWTVPGPPAAAAEVGDELTVTGEVQRIAIEMHTGPDVDLTVVVPPEGEGEPVRVPDEAVQDVPTGATAEVKVKGADPDEDVTSPTTTTEVLDVTVLDEGSGADEWAAAQKVEHQDDDHDHDHDHDHRVEIAESSALAGTRTVHLYTARLPGQSSDGIRAQHLRSDLVNQVDPYWSASTGGRIRFRTGTERDNMIYHGWGSTRTCTNSQIVGLLQWASLNAGHMFAAGHGEHALVYTPRVAACGFAGVAHVANGGAAWVNGDTNSSTRWPIIAHELGHNLMLGHSHSRTACSGATSDGTSSRCRNGDYGDGYDLMGTASRPGPLSGAQLDALGLLDSTNSVRATSSRTVDLAPVGGLRGVRFLTFTSGGITYYVEYRAAVGRDSDLATNRVGCPTGLALCSPPTRIRPGVVVRRTDVQRAGRETFLLDPGTSSARFVMGAGRSFTTRDGEVTVTVTSVNSSRARIRLVMPSTTGNEYHLRNDLRSGVAHRTFRYGRGDDHVLVGSWYGRAGDSFAIRRGNTYHLHDGLGPGDARDVIHYGRADDVVLVGDWNGDGRSTLAVRRGRTYHIK
ncbi:metallopeptidase domain-containing protein, partial [Cellulomonas bogoriensis]|uniref:hypothetical protein n=1 Tax=Cellulomonas bogoriensis TaxID=301388 RepID=UPI0018DC0735